MSRSRKKAIYKDSGLSTSEYWRPIRHHWKQRIRQFPNELWRGRFGYWEFDDSLPNPKSLINDYDYCDWINDMEYDYHVSKWRTKEDVLKYRELLRRK